MVINKGSRIPSQPFHSPPSPHPWSYGWSSLLTSVRARKESREDGLQTISSLWLCAPDPENHLQGRTPFCSHNVNRNSFAKVRGGWEEQDAACPFKYPFINLPKLVGNEKVQNTAPLAATHRKPEEKLCVRVPYYSNRLKGHKQGTN